MGLLLGAEPDSRPLAELETLTGRSASAEVRALAALVRGDSAVARKTLADSGRKPDRRKLKGDVVYLGFAWNDSRPLEAASSNESYSMCHETAIPLALRSPFGV